MQSNEYGKMAEMEDHYWWHVGRVSIIRRMLRLFLPRHPFTTILNIGSGTGGTIPMLSKFGKVTNVDTSPLAIQYLQNRGITDAMLIHDSTLPFDNSSFDVAVAFDVLEHIKNDSTAIQEWHRVLKPGGRLVITVPAYQWLWSGHDETLHHFRRYTASGLHQLLNINHFQVIKKTYAIVFSFPLIVGFRLFQSMFSRRSQSSSYVILPKPINTFLTLILKLEGLVLQLFNMPFGTSVLIVAQKGTK